MVAPNPSPFASPPTLIYSTGPWTKDNLVTAVELFFQPNAYHPFAQCSHPQKHSDPVPLTEILPKSAGTSIADRKMLHYCPHRACAGLDSDNFRSNRKEVKNMDFLDKSNIFSYRTIGLGETIRNPIKTSTFFSQGTLCVAKNSWRLGLSFSRQGPWQPNTTGKLQNNCTLQLFLPTFRHHHH